VNRPLGDAPALVARVVVDEPAITKAFDYVVPPSWRDHVRVGTVVRVALGPRRVGGWVTELGVAPPEGVELRSLAKVTGYGPDPAMIELARWAAWRWAGRLVPLLVTASAPHAVPSLPPRPSTGVPLAGPFDPDAVSALAASAADGRPRILRRGPTDDPLPVVLAAMALGPALVVTPSIDQARLLAAQLRRSGRPVALHPRDWPVAAAGGTTVIGARAAAFAPAPDVAAIVVLDEHDEALQEERVPCWHGRDVAIERARRAGVPCLLVSPCPTPEAWTAAVPVRPSRQRERSSWPILDIVDRRRDAPSGSGPISEKVAAMLHRPERVVIVTNRPGQARLLACGACATLARCERCGAAVSQPDAETLHCARCGLDRPLVCVACGSTRLVVRRAGVARLHSDLERMLGEPVAQWTKARAGDPVPSERVVIGTEAALHVVDHAGLVVFTDFDDELLAPRLRAHDQAIALLARAARVVGPRPGRIAVQTVTPDHPVLTAVLRADPEVLLDQELRDRRALSMPPFVALGVVSGPEADSVADQLRGGLVTVAGPNDGSYLLRAPDHATLADALAAIDRPSGRTRIEVDPLRV
jgi:primosomal protein N' (replication factor Y)